MLVFLSANFNTRSTMNLLLLPIFFSYDRMILSYNMPSVSEIAQIVCKNNCIDFG